MANPLNVSREHPAVIFVNPHAGGGKARRCLTQIKSLLSARSFLCEFISDGSAEEMASSVRAAISAGSQVLLAMGGDGTLQCLVNAAQNADAVLGVVPTGGGNDFAAALGLPKNPVQAVEAILSGEPRRVDLLRARTADGRERLYVGGGGIGLDADAARYTSSSFARLPGRLRYVASALRALKEFKRLQVHAQFPGGGASAINAQVFVASVLNTPSFGAGLRLAPEARIDDGLLNVVFVKKLSAAAVFMAVARLLTRGDLPSSYVTRARASRVRLIPDRECLFHGDGEILGPAPVEIEVVPKAIRMLAPAAHCE